MTNLTSADLHSGRPWTIGKRWRFGVGWRWWHPEEMPRKKSKTQVGRNVAINYSYLILRISERDINVHRSSCKVSVILVRFLWNLNFLDRFSEKSRASNFMKICPAGAEIFYADGQTDTTKLIVAFRHFANANVFSPARYVELFYITLNANKCHWVPRLQDPHLVSQNIQTWVYLSEQFFCPQGLVHLFRY